MQPNRSHEGPECRVIDAQIQCQAKVSSPCSRRLGYPTHVQPLVQRACGHYPHWHTTSQHTRQPASACSSL